MRPKPARAARGSADDTRLAIESFLSASTQPVLIEPGEAPFAIVPGSFEIEERGSFAVFSVWDDSRSLSRKIVAARPIAKGRLELDIERFGGRAGTITAVDLARPQNGHWHLRTERMTGRERLRHSLGRQFPEWKIVEVSSEPDLEHSLSPVCARAFLRRGTAGLAVIGASDSQSASSAMTFGLIWLDYLRGRERKCAIEGLAVFLPSGCENDTALRMKHLDPSGGRWELWATSPDGYEDRIDWRDIGNINTRVEPRSEAADVENHAVAGRLSRLHGVETLEAPGGASFRVRGLEIARLANGRVQFGIDALQDASESNWREIERLTEIVSRMRRGGLSGAAAGGPLCAREPERWLESMVRGRIETVDASLLPTPVYGQVPAMAGLSRDILDLVAVDRGGRLAIVELKASEDIHLPMQALDYWIRVKWHLERGDFSTAGYFPGIVLSNAPPRLLLVSPALQMHPANEAVLRYVSREVDVEQVGVSASWRTELRVVARRRFGSGANRASI